MGSAEGVATTLISTATDTPRTSHWGTTHPQTEPTKFSARHLLGDHPASDIGVVEWGQRGGVERSRSDGSLEG